jgi:glycine hydroxymethyltransferase
VRDIEYEKFRTICDANKAYLLVDMAHTAGLISAGLLNSPFKYADVVTTTTHKTLRGPRGALIFYKKEYKDRIDFAVFPSLQGGPHNNTIAGIATALKQVATEEFKTYAKQVVLNARALAYHLQMAGIKVATGGTVLPATAGKTMDAVPPDGTVGTVLPATAGKTIDAVPLDGTAGTDNHIVLMNVASTGCSASRYERLCELVNVSVNKNTMSHDKSALNPSGIRLGTPAMTSRGFVEDDFIFVSMVLVKLVDLCVKIESKTSSKSLVEFNIACKEYEDEIQEIRNEVTGYVSKLPYPN